MNIDKLITAAKEIDRLSILQEEKSRKLMEIARMVKEAYENGDDSKVRRLQAESRNIHGVIDFGGAINDLRKALRAK